MPRKSQPTTNRHLGHHIREWRLFRGMTLEALAEAIGMTHGAIQQLETGTTQYRQPTLESIAKALGVQAWVLIAFPPPGATDDMIARRRVLAGLFSTLPEEEQARFLAATDYLKTQDNTPRLEDPNFWAKDPPKP